MAFLLLGLPPLLAVGAWCAWRHSNAHVRLAAEAMSQRLGLTVSLRNLAHPRPGVDVYQGLQVIDPETGRTVLRCRSVEVRTGSTSATSEDGYPELIVTADTPELELRGLEELSRLIQEAMQGRLGPRNPRWTFSAAEVHLVAGGTSQTLIEVQASTSAPAGGVQAEMAFRLPKLNMPEPARIRLGRNRQISPPAAGFELSTGGTKLPCSLLGLGLPEFQRAGANSRFSGYVWANQNLGGWQGEMVGQWSNLDLGELLGDRSAHKLTGPAEVYLQFARFRDGRLEEAAGTISAGPGVVSRSLLTAAVERLSLTRGADPNTPGEFVPFEQLAVAFLLNSKGLQLQGRCAGTGQGSILVDRYCRLLGDPVMQPRPVTALLQMLVASGEQQVPASRQAERLLRVLPLPEVQVPVTAQR
jgi:hypothetical protein